jgi:hypothetical protein
MKSIILLTTALFLASAPSPDSKTISEFSAGFLSATDDHGLMAAEPSWSARASTGTAAQPTAQPANKETGLPINQEGQAGPATTATQK